MEPVTDIGAMISRREGVQGGRPCITGTRVSVRGIAVRHQQGQLPEEMVEDWPHVTLAQIYAALAYYYANKAEIDADLEAEARLEEELAKKYPAARQCV